MVYPDLERPLWVETDATNRILARGFFKGNYKDSLWESYYSDTSQLMCRMYYKEGLANGYFQCFYPSGQLMQQGQMSMGKRTGWWESFEQNGDTLLCTTYNDNKEEGLCILYTEGKRRCKGNKHAGRAVGLWWNYETQSYIEYE